MGNRGECTELKQPSERGRNGVRRALGQCSPSLCQRTLRKRPHLFGPLSRPGMGLLVTVGQAGAAPSPAPRAEGIGNSTHLEPICAATVGKFYSSFDLRRAAELKEQQDRWDQEAGEQRGQDLDLRSRMLKASGLLMGAGQREWQGAGKEGVARTPSPGQGLWCPAVA